MNIVWVPFSDGKYRYLWKNWESRMLSKHVSHNLFYRLKKRKKKNTNKKRTFATIYRDLKKDRKSCPFNFPRGIWIGPGKVCCMVRGASPLEIMHPNSLRLHQPDIILLYLPFHYEMINIFKNGHISNSSVFIINWKSKIWKFVLG